MQAKNQPTENLFELATGQCLPRGARALSSSHKLVRARQNVEAHQALAAEQGDQALQEGAVDVRAAGGVLRLDPGRDLRGNANRAATKARAQRASLSARARGTTNGPSGCRNARDPPPAACGTSSPCFSPPNARTDEPRSSRAHRTPHRLARAALGAAGDSSGHPESKGRGVAWGVPECPTPSPWTETKNTKVARAATSR